MSAKKKSTPRSRKIPRPVISGDIPDLDARQAYVFRLFVSGQTEKSARAIDNIKRICEREFPGEYQLEVVDVYQQPQLATGDQIIAVPTLVKKAPGKLKKILGDLSDGAGFIKKLH
jgi:circadian clock protein KaiB